MPDLTFAVEKAEAAPYAAAPLLNFSLRVTDTAAPSSAPAAIHSVALRAQIQIEPARRQYQPAEQERLLDLFGEPSRWGQTLRPMLWAHAAVTIPPFTGHTTVDLPVPCTFDFNVAATKFFAALESDEAPLRLLFSGTIFHAAPDGSLQIAQIPWEKEAAFRLPIRVWRDMMDLYYPNSAWLRLRSDTFDRLRQYKTRRGLPTWEAAIDSLLDAPDRPHP